MKHDRRTRWHAPDPAQATNRQAVAGSPAERKKGPARRSGDPARRAGKVRREGGLKLRRFGARDPVAALLDCLAKGGTLVGPPVEGLEALLGQRRRLR